MIKINFVIFILSFIFTFNIFAQNESKVYLPLIIDNQFEEMIKITVDQNNVIKKVLIGPRLNNFKKYLNSEASEKLIKSLNSDGSIDNDSLKQLGINSQYDLTNVELKINIDPQVRQKNIISFNTKNNYSHFDLKDPAHFSGYLNYYLTKNYQYKEGATNPFLTSFESALNIHSFVLEADLDYVEQEIHKWQRRDIKLVKDFPSHDIRVMVGDLRYDMIGYETSRNLGGISIDNDFSLTPSKISNVLSTQDFYLKNRSNVKIFINDRFIRTLDLNAGNHSLDELPIQTGLNDVKIEISDDSGRTETLNFLHHTSKDLLKKGTSDFNYTVGVPYKDEAGVRHYSNDDKSKTVSLFHRYGLSNYWTPGLFFQGDNYQYLVGVENTFSTKIGIFSFNAAESDTYQTKQGYALKLIYQIFDYHGPNGSTRRLSLSGEKISATFANLGSLNPYNKIQNRFGASYAQNLWENMSVNLNFDYSLNQVPIEVDPFQASISFSNRWTKKLSTSIFLARNRLVNNEWNDSAFIILNYDMPEDKQSINTFYDTQNKNKRGDFNFRTQSQIGYINGGIGVDQGETNQKFRGSFGLDHEKFVTNFKHEINDDKSKDSLSNDTQIRFSQGLVFARNRFAISRPISNSFAIIAPNKYLKGEIVSINPSADGDLAHARYWYNGVVPSMTPYQPYMVQLDSTLMTPGKNIGKEYYWLNPTYKSGHVIDIGAPGTVLLIGYLVDEKNSPMQLIVGELINLKNEKERIQFFTDKQGRFMLEGLMPGDYLIELTESNIKTKIVIQNSVKGVYKIGKIVVRKEG